MGDPNGWETAFEAKHSKQQYYHSNPDLTNPHTCQHSQQLVQADPWCFKPCCPSSSPLIWQQQLWPNNSPGQGNVTQEPTEGDSNWTPRAWKPVAETVRRFAPPWKCWLSKGESTKEMQILLRRVRGRAEVRLLRQVPKTQTGWTHSYWCCQGFPHHDPRYSGRPQEWKHVHVEPTELERRLLIEKQGKKGFPNMLCGPMLRLFQLAFIAVACARK